MPTTAENIRKNNETLKKALATHKAKEEKYLEVEVRRLVKILQQTSYFDQDFTDKKLLLILQEAFDSTTSEKSVGV